jgi:hypothetical protein
VIKNNNFDKKWRKNGEKMAKKWRKNGEKMAKNGEKMALLIKNKSK